MSTTERKNGTEFVAAPNGSIAKASKRPNRPRGKYKPRLATNIKVVMEEAVLKSTLARRWMGLILVWVAEERAISQCDIQALVETAPITAIAREMDRDRLIRLGELAEYVAHLAVDVTAIESELREALDHSREASP